MDFRDVDGRHNCSLGCTLDVLLRDLGKYWKMAWGWAWKLGCDTSEAGEGVIRRAVVIIEIVEF